MCMRDLLLLLVVPLFFCANEAHAGPAEARDIARLNNCTPKKVEVYQQKMGADAQTIYRVECIEPKAVNDKAPKMASAMLVRCDGALCEMLRPFDTTTK